MSRKGPRILYATGATYVRPLRAAFDLALAAGCDGVELDVCPETVVRGLDPVLRLSAESGLPVRAIHPPLFPFPGWRGGAALCRLAKQALALGAPTIVVHPPRVRRLDGPGIAEFTARLAEAQALLEGSGTEITLENPGLFRPRDRGYPLWHMPALRRFAGQCGLRLTLDTTHAGVSPYPLMDSYALARDRLAHVHLSDLCTPPPWLDRAVLASYVKHHQLPGAGYLPLPQFLQALARDHYQGDIALELSPVSLEVWDLARTRRHLAEAVQATRRMLAA